MGVVYLGMRKYDLLKTNTEELMAVARSDEDDVALGAAMSGFVDYYLHEKIRGSLAICPGIPGDSKKTNVPIQLKVCLWPVSESPDRHREFGTL